MSNHKRPKAGELKVNVHEDHRAVVAYTVDCADEALKQAEKILTNHGIGIDVWVDQGKALYNRMKMSKRYAGKSHCDPRDTWNEETGASFATDRVLVKFKMAKAKRLLALSNKLWDAASEVQEAAWDLLDQASEAQERIDVLHESLK